MANNKTNTIKVRKIVKGNVILIGPIDQFQAVVRQYGMHVIAGVNVNIKANNTDMFISYPFDLDCEFMSNLSLITLKILNEK